MHWELLSRASWSPPTTAAAATAAAGGHGLRQVVVLAVLRGEEHAALKVLVLGDAAAQLQADAAQPRQLSTELRAAVVLVTAVEGQDDLRDRGWSGGRGRVMFGGNKREKYMSKQENDHFDDEIDLRPLKFEEQSRGLKRNQEVIKRPAW